MTRTIIAQHRGITQPLFRSSFPPSVSEIVMRTSNCPPPGSPRAGKRTLSASSLCRICERATSTMPGANKKVPNPALIASLLPILGAMTPPFLRLTGMRSVSYLFPKGFTTLVFLQPAPACRIPIASRRAEAKNRQLAGHSSKHHRLNSA